MRLIWHCGRASIATALLWYGAGAQSQPAPSQMSTTGPCSPIVDKTAGNVNMTVYCLGVGDAAMAALNDLLRQRNLELADKVKEANSWADKYRQLEAKLAAVGPGGEIGKAARSKLASGDLAGAQGAIDQLETELQRRDQDILETQKLTRASFAAMAAQLAKNGMKPGGVFHADLRWKKDVIIVCFLDGSQAARSYVARTAMEWTLYGNISFDFGSLMNPRICSPSNSADVRVTLQGDGFWSFVGTNNLKAPPTIATVNLALGGMDDKEIVSGKYTGEILHEFGHVLGFDHAIHGAGAVCDQEIDFTKAYEYFKSSPNNWTRAEVDGNLRSNVSGDTTSGVFDGQSVMGIGLPAQIFKAGTSSPCFSPFPQQLSLGDRLAVATFYPAAGVTS